MNILDLITFFHRYKICFQEDIDFRSAPKNSVNVINS